MKNTKNMLQKGTVAALTMTMVFATGITAFAAAKADTGSTDTKAISACRGAR